MKILQLCKKFPYPLKDGESIAVTYLSKALSEEGCEITLLAMNTVKHYTDVTSLPADYDHYHEIHVTDLDNRVTIAGAITNLFSSKSYHVSRFESEPFAQKLVELLQSTDYDVVQLETMYLTPYVELIRKHSRAIVSMRAHNIEFEIWERIISNTTNPIKKAYIKYLSKKLKKYELATLNSYDYLVPVSQRDFDRFVELGYKKDGLATPIGLDISQYSPSATKQIIPNTLCFIGAMDWMPNREGLDWFLEHVWPDLHRKMPKLQLHIAGLNTPKDLLQLEMPNVMVHGEVPSAIDFICRYQLMIVPLLSGSGMRVKILEGMALGKAIVSTSIGKEGITATHKKEIVVADDAEAFVREILYCFSKPSIIPQLSANALTFVSTEYEHKSIARRLLERYKGLVAH